MHGLIMLKVDVPCDICQRKHRHWDQTVSIWWDIGWVLSL